MMDGGCDIEQRTARDDRRNRRDGTSSDGMLVCRVAELMRDQVDGLVLVHALALFAGEEIRDIVTRSTSVMGELTVEPAPGNAANRMFTDSIP